MSRCSATTCRETGSGTPSGLVSRRKPAPPPGQPKPYTAESVKADAVAYRRFAVGKAEDHRGISAGRSIEKMREYLWLLGDDALLGRFLDAPYPQYGAPQLKVLWDAWLPDEAINETVAVMATGNLCRDDCQGCGVW